MILWTSTSKQSRTQCLLQTPKGSRSTIPLLVNKAACKANQVNKVCLVRHHSSGSNRHLNREHRSSGQQRKLLNREHRAQEPAVGPVAEDFCSGLPLELSSSHNHQECSNQECSNQEWGHSKSNKIPARSQYSFFAIQLTRAMPTPLSLHQI